MRTLLPILATALLLSGCALVAEEAVVGGAELEAAGGLVESAGAVTGAETSAISISGDLASVAEEQSVVSRWLQESAKSGQTATLYRSGILRVNNTTLGRFESDGNFVAADGRPVAHLDAQTGMLYQDLPSTQAVATLEGFVPENGVRFEYDGGTRFDILRPNVIVKVLKIENGYYRVLLPNGAVGRIPMGAAILTLFGLAQALSACPEDESGAVVLKSGQEIPFDQCKRLDDAMLVHSDSGPVIVSMDDVDRILVGDKIPKALPYDAAALDGVQTFATTSKNDQSEHLAALASSPNTHSNAVDDSSSDESNGSEAAEDDTARAQTDNAESNGTGDKSANVSNEASLERAHSDPETFDCFETVNPSVHYSFIVSYAESTVMSPDFGAAGQQFKAEISDAYVNWHAREVRNWGFGGYNEQDMSIERTTGLLTDTYSTMFGGRDITQFQCRAV